MREDFIATLVLANALSVKAKLIAQSVPQDLLKVEIIVFAQ